MDLRTVPDPLGQPREGHRIGEEVVEDEEGVVAVAAVHVAAQVRQVRADGTIILTDGTEVRPERSDLRPLTLQDMIEGGF